MRPALLPPQFGEGDGSGVDRNENLFHTGLGTEHRVHPKLLRAAPLEGD